MYADRLGKKLRDTQAIQARKEASHECQFNQSPHTAGNRHLDRSINPVGAQVFKLFRGRVFDCHRYPGADASIAPREKIESKVEEYMDDSAITAKIKAEILSDPLLKVSQINVTTTNGVVSLSGTVDSQQSIDRALAIARSVKDVKSVENGLVR
jgi:hypothetical protein